MVINEYYWTNRYNLLIQKQSRDTVLLILYQLFNDLQEIFLNRKQIYCKNVCKCTLIYGDNSYISMKNEIRLTNNNPVKRIIHLYNSIYRKERMYDDDGYPFLMEGSIMFIYKQNRIDDDIEIYRYYMRRNNYKIVNLYDEWDNIATPKLKSSIIEKDIKKVCDRFMSVIEDDFLPDEYKNKEYFWHEFEYYFRQEISNHKLVLKDN